MITQAKLKELFDYEAETGRLRRAELPDARYERHPGTTNSSGYLQIKIRGKRYLNHRLIWLWHFGSWPADQLDHIDGNPANNRIENLRECTRAQNMQNMRTLKGLKGASVHSPTGRWRARIRAKGAELHLGLYDTEEEAHAAYCAAAEEHFGEFARFE